MADLRKQPEEEHDGASPGEQLIEAARRNNVDLLHEVLEGCKTPEEASSLLNDTKTVLGNHIYHEAALRGNYDIIDTLLDQPNFECDPINRLEGDTPLHSAVRFINSLPHPLSADNLSFASSLLSMMTEAGSDARIRNKAKLTAAQLCDPRNDSLKRQLEDAVEIEQNQGDFVSERDLVGLEERDDDGDVGSASDSDFDPEEYKREQERRRREGK